MKLPASVVLCPTDASPIGNAAVPLAYRLVADQGTVHLVHVCEPPYVGNPIYPPYVFGTLPAPGSTTDGKTRIKAAMKALVPESAKARHVQTQVHLLEDEDPAVAIGDLAESLDVDVVVMGTHGRSALGRLILGSVASQVLKQTSRAVLLARPERRVDA